MPDDIFRAIIENTRRNDPEGWSTLVKDVSDLNETNMSDAAVAEVDPERRAERVVLDKLAGWSPTLSVYAQLACTEDDPRVSLARSGNTTAGMSEAGRRDHQRRVQDFLGGVIARRVDAMVQQIVSDGATGRLTISTLDPHGLKPVHPKALASAKIVSLDPLQLRIGIGDEERTFAAELLLAADVEPLAAVDVKARGVRTNHAVKAEEDCVEWLRHLPAEPVRLKQDVRDEARVKFPKMSPSKGFDRAWTAGAHTGWKRQGRRPTPRD